jgi:hypothetical protein
MLVLTLSTNPEADESAHKFHETFLPIFPASTRVLKASSSKEWLLAINEASSLPSNDIYILCPGTEDECGLWSLNVLVALPSLEEDSAVALTAGMLLLHASCSSADMTILCPVAISDLWQSWCTVMQSQRIRFVGVDHVSGRELRLFTSSITLPFIGNFQGLWALS